MIITYVLYDRHYPYLPIDWDDSLPILALRWNVPVKTLYNALRNGCVVRSTFTIQKIIFDDD